MSPYQPKVEMFSLRLTAQTRERLDRLREHLEVRSAADVVERAVNELWKREKL